MSSHFNFEGQDIPFNEGDSILDALLAQGQSVANSCRSGLCQSCVLKCEAGEVPALAQKGLQEAQKQLKYFMSCQCAAAANLSVSKIDSASLRAKASVIYKSMISDDVIRLRLKSDVQFLAGQYLTLWKDEHIGRSYSVASSSDSPFMEFHIKVIEGGAFSGWAKDNLKEGDTLDIQGPLGKCIYSAQPDQPILLAGIGTGLAPLMGIIADAVNRGHQGQLDLLVAAKARESLYLADELLELESKLPQLNVHTLVQEEGADIYEYAKTHFAELKGSKVYLCGAPSFVQKMRKHCFMTGAGMMDIHADSFVPAQV